MQLTVTFSDKTISIMNKEGIVNLSPYFYYFNQRVMIGKQIEQAIDLFPEYISNVFFEKDEKKLGYFLQELNDYVIKSFKVKNYKIELSSNLSHLNNVIKNTLPNVSVKIKNDFTNKIPVELEKHLHNALSTVITNELIRTCQVSGSLFQKINRIVRLRIDFYIKELLEKGRTNVQLKFVDNQYSVQFICKEVNDQIPSINRIIEIYKQSINSHERIVQSLYEVYDGNFKVTFISPFSYGKSTLINGLFGEKMLNMDIRAETAIITKIVSSDENRLFVKYEDNRIEMQTYENYEDLREKLKTLTSVRGIKTPSEVQIYHTLGYFPGVTIIDAPGLNSRHAEHNKKASDAIQMSDLVIFLINPAHIGEANFSRQIKEFLELIHKNNKKYGFVLSKLDLYSDDYDVIMKEMETVLQDLDPSYSINNVFFVSGYFALFGKLLRDDKIDVNDVRKSHGIFVIENDEIIMGRGIEKHHSSFLLQFSKIEQLEQFIIERGDNHATNKLYLDRRERETAKVNSPS